MNNFAPTTIIGLTGGIGAGKSTAESFCKSKKIITADADRWSHEILKYNDIVIKKIVDYFRQVYNLNPLLDSGELNRKLIASIAFRDVKTIRFLEQLIHPIVKQKTKDWILEQQNNNAPMAVLIVPLLLESKLSEIVDVIVVIASTREIRMKRLKEHRKCSEKQILARMKNQLSEEERIMRAHYIVENNGSIEEFRNNFYSVLKKIEKNIN